MRPMFKGFPDAGLRFFRELKKRQDRDWFKAHKDDYEREWVAPMQALLDEARIKLERTYAPHRLGTPKVFRIQRDVRFGKDKTPYKTSISGWIPVDVPRSDDERSAPTALYVEVGLETFAGCGMWIMQPEPLQRFRDALLDDFRGPAFARLLDKTGFDTVSHDELKTAPRGIDPAHPRIDILRKKGLALRLTAPSRIGARTLVDDLVKDAKKAAPVVKWLIETAR
jgi:uncharacterized protein (TIGR02453 family)